MTRYYKWPRHLLKSTIDYWQAWLNKYTFDFHTLPESVIHTFKKSLFYVRAHADHNGGMIAAGDTTMLNYGKDTYAYVWPRDAALSSMSMNLAGDQNVSRRFFEFCQRVISRGGYFMHKFLPDGSLGSSWHPWMHDNKSILPIQEDESALVLYSLKHYYDYTRDLEFIEQLYGPLIKEAGEFMVRYRDAQTGLPQPSYDLWEEKYGVHTFSAAATVGGLEAAAFFAGILGKDNDRDMFTKAADEMRAAIIKHLYDPEREIFIKRLDEYGKPDPLIDSSSIYGIYNFDILPADDKRVKIAHQKTLEALEVQTSIGGDCPLSR